MTAADALTDALLVLEDRGERTPCRTSSAHLWTSDDRHEREAATHRCQTCPLLALCRAAADERGERWHVWGTDRTDHGGRRRSP